MGVTISKREGDRVNLSDVAAESGYSVATVSRVLSGSRRVGPEVERRVLAASARLGYRANHVARSLRNQSTATIGMVVPQITNPFFPGLVSVIEQGLTEQGLALLLCDSNDDPQIESARLEMLLDRRVDGVIVIPCDAESSREAVRRASATVPVVQMDRPILDLSTDVISVDNRAGIAAVLDHLAKTGRRQLAYVGAAPSTLPAAERLQAYQDGAPRADSEASHRIQLGEFTIEWGREAANRLLESGRAPEAIVCGNDLIAVGVVLRLRERGLRIAEDVAVTGFDDIPFAMAYDPPITTVRQPLADMGREAVQLLTSRWENRKVAPRHVRLMPSLVIRASTAT